MHASSAGTTQIRCKGLSQLRARYASLAPLVFKEADCRVVHRFVASNTLGWDQLLGSK